MDCQTFELGAVATKQHEAYFLLQQGKVSQILDQGKEVVVALPQGVKATKFEILIDQETARLLTKRGKSLWVRQGPVELQIYPGALITRNFLRKVTAGEPVRVLVEVGPSAEYKERLLQLLSTEGYADYELVSDVYWVTIRGETATTGFDLESFPAPVYVSFRVSGEELGEAEPEYLGLYQYGNTIKYMGGILKSKEPAKVETDLRELNGFYAVLALEKNFMDLRQHPARAAIMQLASRHIFNGNSEDTFGPELPLSRAETAVVMYRSLGIPAYVPNVSPFVDVRPNDWYYREVTSVDKVGLMKGEGGRFQPQDAINRQEIALVLERALAYKGYPVNLSDELVEETLTGIADKEGIARWARRAVALALQAGLMEAVAGTFGPSIPVTRGEGAVLISKMMQRLNLL